MRGVGEDVKIACIATGWYPLSPGGLEKYVFGMTQALVRGGDTVDLFVTGEASAPLAGVRMVSIAHNEDPLWKRAIDARRNFSSGFQPPYDVVNLHFARLSTIASRGSFTFTGPGPPKAALRAAVHSQLT